VPAGLASLGLDADESELAVMMAAHGMFWPGILELISMDLRDASPERNPDLSQGPA